MERNQNLLLFLSGIIESLVYLVVTGAFFRDLDSFMKIDGLNNGTNAYDVDLMQFLECVFSQTTHSIPLSLWLNEQYFIYKFLQLKEFLQILFQFLKMIR